MDSVDKYRKRRKARIEARCGREDDQWITMKGTHVLIDDGGQVSGGPDRVKQLVRGSGGYKKGTKKAASEPAKDKFKTVGEFKKALGDREAAMSEYVRAEEDWKNAKAYRASMAGKTEESLKKDYEAAKRAGDSDKMDKAQHDLDRLKSGIEKYGKDFGVAAAEKKMNAAKKKHESIDARIKAFENEKGFGKSGEAFRSEIDSAVNSLKENMRANKGTLKVEAKKKAASEIKGAVSRAPVGTTVSFSDVGGSKDLKLVKTGENKWKSTHTRDGKEYENEIDDEGAFHTFLGHAATDWKSKKSGFKVSGGSAGEERKTGSGSGIADPKKMQKDFLETLKDDSFVDYWEALDAVEGKIKEMPAGVKIDCGDVTFEKKGGGSWKAAFDTTGKSPASVFSKMKSLSEADLNDNNIADYVLKQHDDGVEVKLRLPRSRKTVASAMRSSSDKETDSRSGTTDLKKRQLEAIKKMNPAKDDYHTWIRSESDIKTFDEVAEEMADVAPDVSRDVVDRAKRTGKIRVYSSHNINGGTFVTPSKMIAKDYAGSGTVKEMDVPIDHVAWIDGEQGQYVGDLSSAKTSKASKKATDVLSAAKRSVGQKGYARIELDYKDRALADEIKKLAVDNGMKVEFSSRTKFGDSETESGRKERKRVAKFHPIDSEPAKLKDYAKQAPSTMEGDFAKEGYKKNSEDRWVKKGGK